MSELTARSYYEPRGIVEHIGERYYRVATSSELSVRYNADFVRESCVEFTPTQGASQYRYKGKWMSAKGSSFCAGYLGETATIEADEVYITEGSGKLLSLEQVGFRAIALYGVANWSARSEKDTRVLHPHLEIALDRASTVWLAFDSDWQTNYNVCRELMELHKALSLAGKQVKFLLWSGKKGIDDQLATMPISQRAAWILGQGRKQPTMTSLNATLKDLKIRNSEEVASKEALERLREGHVIIPNNVDLNVFWAKLYNDAAKTLGYRQDPVSGVVYKFSLGYWLPQDEKRVELEVATYVTSRTWFRKRSKHGDSIEIPNSGSGDVRYYRPIKSITYEPCDRNVYGCIRYLDGLYDLDKQEFLPDEDTVLADTVEMEYGADQVNLPINTIKYLEETVTGSIHRTRAALRYLIDPSVGNGKIVYLNGESGSGKSSIIKLVASLLPTSEIAYKFESANMNSPTEMYDLIYGKKVICFPDIDVQLQSIAALLQLTGSSDTSHVEVSVRPLYGQARTIKTKARVLWASVTPIRIAGGADEGLARRIFTLHTKASKAAAKLWPEVLKEQREILHWLLSMPVAEVQAEINAETPAEDRYQRSLSINPVFEFLDSHFKVCAGQKIKTSEVYDLYRAWAMTQGVKPLSSPTFKTRLKQAMPNAVQEIRDEKGRAHWLVGFVPSTPAIAQAILSPSVYEGRFQQPGGLAPIQNEPTEDVQPSAEVPVSTSVNVMAQELITVNEPNRLENEPTPLTPTPNTPEAITPKLMRSRPPGLEDIDSIYIAPEPVPVMLENRFGFIQPTELIELSELTE